MSRKLTLTIDNWTGSGTGSISIPIGGYAMIERTLRGRTTSKLIVNRRPDQYSSRFGMMATLNKNAGALAWGFPAMSLTAEDRDARGRVLSSLTYDFTGVAVADSRVTAGDEELTFVFNAKTEFKIGPVEVFAQ